MNCNTTHYRANSSSVPGDPTREDVGERLAEWTDADWKSADVVAAQVVSDILAQHFWPPNYDQRYIDEELAPICQDYVSGRELALVEGAAS